MKNTERDLSVLLLTEDGDGAYVPLRTFVVKLLGHIAPGAVTRDDPRWWEPTSHWAREAVRGPNWKSPRRQDHVRLHQYIATKLRQEHGFVFLHVDGDRAYRDRAQSENYGKLETMIRLPVRRVLQHPPMQRRERRRAVVGLDPGELDQRLTKLVFLVPFYSIEAWLFQNAERAARSCRGAPRCRHGCAEKLAVWSRDRAALDEIERPKTQLCFGDEHNAELAAAGYPLAEVLRANKSLRDALTALEGCIPLVTALEQRQPHWQR